MLVRLVETKKATKGLTSEDFINTKEITHAAFRPSSTPNDSLDRLEIWFSNGSNWTLEGERARKFLNVLRVETERVIDLN